jgi:hypothetical protein
MPTRDCAAQRPSCHQRMELGFVRAGPRLFSPPARASCALARLRDGPEHCTACGRARLVPRVLREAPAILLAQADGVALNPVSLPLRFDTTMPADVEEGTNVPETEVYYELASFAHCNDAYCVALVRGPGDSNWVLELLDLGCV